MLITSHATGWNIIMSVPSWNEFVKANLLNYKILSGVLLLTRTGQVAYSYGDLTDLPHKNEVTKLMELIIGCGSKERDHAFQLTLKNKQTTKFEIYQKTNCSIYAASHGSQDGIAICNLPYGVMVCLYHYPVTASKAVGIIERFCDMLRA